jgi:hypothetical protein
MHTTLLTLYLCSVYDSSPCANTGCAAAVSWHAMVPAMCAHTASRLPPVLSLLLVLLVLLLLVASRAWTRVCCVCHAKTLNCRHSR